MMNMLEKVFAKKDYDEIEVTELASLPASVRAIDVRQPEEFQGDLGHLEGAELVPLGKLASEAKDWNRDEALLLVCRSGNRSGQACSLLKRMGFSKVTNLKGGMLAVRAAEK